MRADPETLASALCAPACYPHAVAAVERLETHISWVFLAGPYAYKVKKPVALGFLDFSTLEARRRYCEDELSLNRRFAPGLYLDVVEIRGTPQHPRVAAGSGPAIEYALRMRRFDQDALASRLLARGALEARLVTDFARYLAHFHASLPPAPPESDFGTPRAVLASGIENFEQIAPLVGETDERDALAALRAWSEREYLRLYDTLKERRAAGWVREGHGDLHLGNIVLLEGRLTPFDCLEFSAALRWNDVMSEIAFLAMDLLDRGATPLAWAFLDAYLEAAGDYAGLAVLRYYLVYRAMVRAKVHLMRASQPHLTPDEAARLAAAYREYLALAQRCSTLGCPAVVVLHGFSGSGKSTVGAGLVAGLGAVRIRSDVERKRLHGLTALARSESGTGGGLYASASTDETYARLASAAAGVLDAGHTALVDATFLKRAQRAQLHALAREKDAPLVVVDVAAPETILRERIAARRRDASEATLDVLEHQLANAEPIMPDEGLSVVRADGIAGCTPALVAEVARRIEGLHTAAPQKDPPA